MLETETRVANQLLSNNLGVFIGGEAATGEGSAISLISPTTGEAVGSLNAASQAQLDHAVDLAKAAFKETPWATSTSLRVKVLTTLANLVEENAATIAYLDAIEAGKLFSESMEGDVPDVVENLRFFTSLIQHNDGRYLEDESGWGWVKKIPVGIAAAILPWNFPVAMLGWKLAPALASGSCLIIKPSEESTLSALYIAQLAHEAGVPPGVIAVLTGDGPGIGQAIGLHNGIDMVSFTGSEEVGRYFLEYSAKSNLKKVALELGGRAVYAVDSEHTSDIEPVITDILESSFGTCGQNCTATSRVVFIGDEADYSRFRDRLAEEVGKVTVGDPFDDGTELGPVISQESHERIGSWLAQAQEKGATVLEPRAAIPGEGYFHAPTVLEGVPADSFLGQGEIFGPVTQLLRLDNREDAIGLVNDEPYGLASTVWCEDVNTAKWWSDQYRVGTLAINGYSEGTVATPFGGLRQSGFWGRDNGPDALAGYQETMTVWYSAP